MRKTPRQEAIEAQYGKPIQEVLADTLTRNGSLRPAARELGIDHTTLLGWLADYGIQLHRATVAVIPGPTTAVLAKAS